MRNPSMSGEHESTVLIRLKYEVYGLINARAGAAKKREGIMLHTSSEPPSLLMETRPERVWIKRLHTMES